MRARSIGAAGMLALAVLLGGCTHVAAVQPKPVVDDPTVAVRFAAIDVLLDQGVEILDAPVCRRDAEGVHCKGSTVGGGALAVATERTDADKIAVTVGGEKIFTGSVADVLQQAASPAP